MAKLGRKQAREMIEAYLAQYPNATSSEIGKALGVSKQRAHQFVTLVRGADAPLTDRELRILRYIASGNSNKQIADTLGVTESTIKSQVTLILAKLNANNRAHAVTIAMQQGLITLDEVKSAKTASK